MVYDLYTYTFADGRTLTINTAWIGVTPVLQLKPSWTQRPVVIHKDDLETVIQTIEAEISPYVQNFTSVMAELERLGFVSQYGLPLTPMPRSDSDVTLPPPFQG